jgi:hypothetical protein
LEQIKVPATRAFAHDETKSFAPTSVNNPAVTGRGWGVYAGAVQL